MGTGMMRLLATRPMKAAAKALEFEKAAALRDEIRQLQEEE